MKIKVLYNTEDGYLFFARACEPPRRQLIGFACMFTSVRSEFMEPEHVSITQFICDKDDRGGGMLSSEDVRSMSLHECIYFGWCVKTRNYRYNKKRDKLVD